MPEGSQEPIGGNVDARPTTRQRWQAVLKLLACLALFEVVYLFTVFDSHGYNSTVRWLIGFWLQGLLAIYVLVVWWRERAKIRKRSGESI
jgi:hypothetical protein